jgi:hypothetical protein
MILLILPADYFDKGQSICLSVLLFNEKCYGCGMTRAIQHIIHFDFITAYSYNKASFIVLSFLTFIWLIEIIYTYKKINNSEYEVQYVYPLFGLVTIIQIAISKITMNNNEALGKRSIAVGVILGIVSSVFSILISIAIAVAIINSRTSKSRI